MQSILVVAIAALLTSVHARAQESSQPASQLTSGPDGLACFENLTAPEFPKSALREHVDGTVWTRTQVSQQGTIEKIETQVVSGWGQGEKLLLPPVEKAIRTAKIKSECAGKKVSVVFRYRLYGEATPNPNVTSKTHAPNIMDIESQPATKTEVSSGNKTSAKP